MADHYCQATVSPALPAHLFTAEELRSLAGACGLSADKEGEEVYFCAEQFFSEVGEDEDGSVLDCTELLQEKLRQLDPEAYPAIVIHGTATCSKMRPGEFGGFAVFISREAVRSHSTWQWLAEPAPPAGQRPYSVLLLYPDYAAGQYGHDTFYTFVRAADPLEAVALAQREAAGNDGGIDDPADFHPLLVTEGHHVSEALFNQ